MDDEETYLLLISAPSQQTMLGELSEWSAIGFVSRSHRKSSWIIWVGIQLKDRVEAWGPMQGRKHLAAARSWRRQAAQRLWCCVGRLGYQTGADISAQSLCGLGERRLPCTGLVSRMQSASCIHV